MCNRPIPTRMPTSRIGLTSGRDAERKHLTNVLKMVAYQAEGDLVVHL
jgi:hypothetical protein